MGLAVLAACYGIWAGLFIYHSSYVAIDGHRYFGLFDDAMISMRYAWNFAHGHGLAWNAGQRVEGYSNLLMTLAMSLAAVLLPKPFAVLAIQVAGIPTMLGIAWLAWRVAAEILGDKPQRRLIGWVVGACVLFYYPLSYWTLMGMETGLVTLLTLAGFWFAQRWVRTNRTADVVGMSMAAGLAFLARNDSIVLSVVTFAYAAYSTRLSSPAQHRAKGIVRAVAWLLAVVIGQTAFRYIYYGTLLPNTYILKLTGIPLTIRLIGGTRFVLEFLQESWLALALAAIGLLIEFDAVRAFLASLMLAAVAYQIYAGGDPWESWRLLAPGMPGVFTLSALGAAHIVARLPRPLINKWTTGIAIGTLTFGGLGLADVPFAADMAVRGPTSAAIANRVNTNTAIALQALTSPQSSVGVIWAGTLPYYADRTGVDFLGKSDAYIAHLQADVTGAVSWGGMISVPGHNKYDLEYSIVRLRPTYIQGYAWGYQTVKPWVVQNYVRVEYHGAQGTKTVFLLKDSPLVCWTACQNQYKLIPWPRQK
jgi:hypothetical protein